MHLQCPHCGFSKEIDSSKIPAKASKACCPKCTQYFPLTPAIPITSARSKQHELEPPRIFYIGEKARKMMTLAFVAVIVLSVFMLLLVLFKSQHTKPLLIYGIVMAMLIQVATCGWVFWMMRTPVVEITTTTFSFWPAWQRGRFNFLKTLMARLYCIRWEDVIGYSISRSEIAGLKSLTVKFDIKSDGPVSNERVYRVTTDRLDELTVLIERLSPQKALSASQIQNMITPSVVGEVRYRDWQANYSGIEGPQGVISWNQVTSIDYPPFVIGGFGSIAVTHKRSGFAETFSVPARATEQYQEFVRFVAFHAKDATIAPGVMKMLSYPASETRKELVAIGLLISGALLVLGAAMIVDYFAEANLSREFYVLLPYTLGIITGLMTVKALAGRFQGKMVSGTTKVRWALALNLSQPLVILFVCVVSSFFFNYLSGYVYEMAGKYPEAEKHYLAAWQESPKNVCTAFDLGLLYRKQGKHELAYEYFEKAYAGDPSYWAGPAIALIPDSLAQMGEIERALKRCDELLAENRNKKRITDDLLQAKSVIKNMSCLGTVLN